jgi:hypothetical protein
MMNRELSKLMGWRVQVPRQTIIVKNGMKERGMERIWKLDLASDRLAHPIVGPIS